MKIVFCDMSLHQAQHFLLLLDETTENRPAYELDFKYGYTVLRSVLKQMPIDTSRDGVYLCNSPAALALVKEAIMEEYGDSVEFNDSLYLLSNRCNLIRALEVARNNERFKNEEELDFTVDDAVEFMNEVNGFVGDCA